MGRIEGQAAESSRHSHLLLLRRRVLDLSLLDPVRRLIILVVCSGPVLLGHTLSRLSSDLLPDDRRHLGKVKQLLRCQSVPGYRQLVRHALEFLGIKQHDP